MSRRVIGKRLGELLVERKIVSADQLEHALRVQLEKGGLLGQILVSLGYASEEAIAQAVTAQYGFPYLPLSNYEIDGELTQLIPQDVARKYCLVAIDRIGNALTLAMADPSNVQAIEDIELLTKCVVQTFVSTPSDINRAIDKFYRHKTNNSNAAFPPPPGKPAG